MPRAESPRYEPRRRVGAAIHYAEKGGISITDASSSRVAAMKSKTSSDGSRSKSARRGAAARISISGRGRDWGAICHFVDVADQSMNGYGLMPRRRWYAEWKL